MASGSASSDQLKLPTVPVESVMIRDILPDLTSLIPLIDPACVSAAVLRRLDVHGRMARLLADHQAGVRSSRYGDCRPECPGRLQLPQGWGERGDRHVDGDGAATANGTCGEGCAR